jgi:phage terminase large subunit
MKSALHSIIPEFIEKLNYLGIESAFEITADEIVSKVTGSKIIFRGLQVSNKDQSANLKSLNGVTIWCMDEAEELTDEKIFEKISLSVRSNLRPNKIIMILNPSTKEHFIYTRFFEENGIQEGFNGSKNKVSYIHTTYLDNLKHLPADYVDDIEQMRIKNPAKYNHTILGGWLSKAEGVIFNNWSIGEFNNDIEYGYGCDWGYSNDPSTLTKVAIDKKNKIIYLDEKVYEPKLSTSDLESRFKKECFNKLIIADNSEPRLIEELKKTGLNIKACIKGAGSIAEGLKLMEDYRFVITDTSTNIIKEFNNYVWNDKKSGTPVDMYNHSIDGVRYFVSNSLKAATGVYHVY